MNAEVLLGISALLLAGLPLFLRSNAVYVFLGLCAGELLAKYAAQDVTQVVSSFVPLNIPLFSIVQITLLLIAPVILLFMYKKAIKASIVLQIVPAVAAAVLGFVLITAKLPYDLQNQIQAANLYDQVNTYVGAAVAAGLFMSVLYFWTKKPKHEHEDKKHKKGKH